MKNSIWFLAASVFIFSCGDLKKDDDGACQSTTQNGDSTVTTNATCTVSTTASEEPTTEIDNSTPEGAFLLKGSVESAFTVVVDGTEYFDMETYFTEEATSLPSKVEAMGYSGYDVTFDAAIGFTDLYQGMNIYVSPETNRGYATTGIVAKNGTFTLALAPEAKEDTYRLRANKRISVLLKKGGEVDKKFCFNFSAIDTASYAEIDKPVIMSTFKSTITKYQCVVDSSSKGLQIPENADKPTNTKTTEVTVQTLPEVVDQNIGFLEPNVTTIPAVYARFPNGGPISGCGSEKKCEDHYYQAHTGLCESDSNDLTPGGFEGYDCKLRFHDEKLVCVLNVRGEYLKPGADWVETCEEAK